MASSLVLLVMSEIDARLFLLFPDLEARKIFPRVWNRHQAVTIFGRDSFPFSSILIPACPL